MSVQEYYQFVLAVLFVMSSGGCQIAADEADSPSSLSALEAPNITVDLAVIKPQVDTFCGNCHSTPPAASFPKAAWPFEVSRGFDFYYESFREDLAVPSKSDVIAYYQSLAPESLTVVAPKNADTSAPGLRFENSPTSLSVIEPPAVSFIKWCVLEKDQPERLVFTDMRSGEIRMVAPDQSLDKCELLTTCSHPAHIEPCDLNGDGDLELVIAELGSLQSGDHARGAVIWLQRVDDQWKQRLLLTGIGRVADVQVADFDKDGDQDLLVAEFGHFRTGRIVLLENESLINGVPKFRVHVLDERHGTIHVPVADLNRDGHLDFVALISQEYEVVEAFLNRGDGTFRREPIFSGHDPAFGSSGIQIVDLDGDNDLDVLYSNGDTFGSEHLKPYHGIYWLENPEEFPFKDHLLANMVGVQKAVAGDVDSDGDLDVVAAGLMPKNLLVSPKLQSHDSLIWLEQTTPGTFVRHGLERAQFYHAGLELADFDRDGDVDIAVGNMHREDGPRQPWLTVWKNLRSKKDLK